MPGDDLALRWFARLLLIVSAGLFVANQEILGGIAVVASVSLLIIGRVVQVRRDVPRD